MADCFSGISAGHFILGRIKTLDTMVKCRSALAPGRRHHALSLCHYVLDLIGDDF